ncbi:S8 family serine peptidase [Actinomadura xylanilytica]|uniref:S8 family serine peptidase n=1 Tax=Actinomadura xylanilytica TaxID=887459 RepID=UPI00255A8EA3|nr:S8 family serine peptidase [Actinomadura xylanilytica]MDL4772605.1 S8 family serine peptidase [Actinomadura xylanilytica]
MVLGRRLIALISCSALLVLHSDPALATPQPRSEEWWFDAWEIEEKVWPLTRGRGIVVAVIDTGVEASLPDLEGAVLHGYEYGGTQNGDGRRDHDKEHGGHGTAMAALIAGQGRGTGMMGVAPDSRILPISEPKFNYADTIRYAVDHGAKVISISSSTPAARCPIAIQRSVTYALQHDVVIVAAAGNDGNLTTSINAPANCPGVLGAGAVDSNLKIWSKTTPGDNVMLAAPGVSVGSIGKDGTFSWKNNGTSQATALTSGVIALMRSRFPRMPARQVVQRLIATAKDVGPEGWDERAGYGALIPYLALTADVPADAPNPVYDRLERLSPGGLASPSRSPSTSSEKSRTTGLEKSSSWIWSGIIMLTAIVVGLGFYGLRRMKARG